MLKAIVQRLTLWFPWLNYDFRHRPRIPVCTVCPGCGARCKHPMRYDPVQKLVVRTCALCSASWGYNPVVRVPAWSKVSEG